MSQMWKQIFLLQWNKKAKNRRRTAISL